jgi:hypothetical protein
MLSMYLRDEGKYTDAIEILQTGVAGGNESAAGRLKNAFRGHPSTNTMYYLGQQEDPERAERYEKIWRILARASYANPTVPEINEIVPLPPAKLPAWDGKLQWLEARRANVPPEKPSQALINQLSKAKLLDPATGRGLPGSPAFSQAHLSAPYCYSGQVYPVVGAGLPAKAPSQSTSLSRLYPTYCRSRLAGEGALPINHSLAAAPDLLWEPACRR